MSTYPSSLFNSPLEVLLDEFDSFQNEGYTGVTYGTQNAEIEQYFSRDFQDPPESTLASHESFATAIPEEVSMEVSDHQLRETQFPAPNDCLTPPQPSQFPYVTVPNPSYIPQTYSPPQYDYPPWNPVIQYPPTGSSADYYPSAEYLPIQCSPTGSSADYYPSAEYLPIQCPPTGSSADYYPSAEYLPIQYPPTSSSLLFTDFSPSPVIQTGQIQPYFTRPPPTVLPPQTTCFPPDQIQTKYRNPVKSSPTNIRGKKQFVICVVYAASRVASLGVTFRSSDRHFLVNRDNCNAKIFVKHCREAFGIVDKETNQNYYLEFFNTSKKAFKMISKKKRRDQVVEVVPNVEKGEEEDIRNYCDMFVQRLRESRHYFTGFTEFMTDYSFSYTFGNLKEVICPLLNDY